MARLAGIIDIYERRNADDDGATNLSLSIGSTDDAGVTPKPVKGTPADAYTDTRGHSPPMMHDIAFSGGAFTPPQSGQGGKSGGVR
jgi:hypothetical protein